MSRSRLSLLLALVSAAPVWAHGLSAGVAEAQLRGRTLFVVVAPTAKVFLDLDANADGLLSATEIQAQGAVLQTRFLEAFAVRDLSGVAPTLGFFDVGVPYEPSPGAPPYVRFTAELSWPEVPFGFTVASHWPDLWLEAVRVEAPEPGRWLAVGPAQSVRLRDDGTLSPPLLEVPGAPVPAARALPPLGWIAVLLTLAAAVFWVWRQRNSLTPKPGALQ
jgi:hypothetical protein